MQMNSKGVRSIHGKVVVIEQFLAVRKVDELRTNRRIFWAGLDPSGYLRQTDDFDGGRPACMRLQ